MRYGLQRIYLEAFLGSTDSTTSVLRLGFASQIHKTDLPVLQSYTLTPGNPTPGSSISLRPSFALLCKYGNIYPFSIRYGFRPLLRIRLTPGRLTLPGKPWDFGEQVFHLFYRYSCQHNHFSAVHVASRLRFCLQRTLPYHSSYDEFEASAPYLAPLHFRRRIIRPVSYYAFFKRWLLLSQRPGCLNNSTTLTTEYGIRGLSCRSGLLPFRRRTLAPAV